MAVYSMTGYASAATALTTDTLRESQLSVEIRSVNSRFLDISFRLPDELRQAEPALRTLITTNIKRGKVEVRAAFENALQNMPVKPSISMLAQLQAIQKDIQSTLTDARSLSVADVMRLTSSQASAVENSTDTTNALLKLTQTVVDELLASRQREGERLAMMLQSQLAQLRVLAKQAGPLIPMLVAHQRTRFMDRWNEAVAMAQIESKPESTQIAMDRALNEATAFAIRIDVAEELTRLASHLEEIERILMKGGETGKRLDFLIQELHREANTLGAKSSVLELTRISVEMKVLIEQMREQVQNLE
jgi:uncharacterized protein (TIGR00255 family)